jgi:DNA ligase-1
MNLADGQMCEVKGSGAKPYVLKNTGGVFSCSCPAWRNQSTPIERRTCKHLKKVLGEAFEAARVGGDMATPAMDPSESTPEAEGEKAPPLLLAHRWENDTDLTGWWMSEKLDGVRAYWDGRRFLSRLGNEYFAPAWFIEGLPPIPLDGELWGGRKKFQRTVSIARLRDALQTGRRAMARRRRGTSARATRRSGPSGARSRPCAEISSGPPKARRRAESAATLQ